MNQIQDEPQLEADLLAASLGGAQSAVELEALAFQLTSVPHAFGQDEALARAVAAELRRRALVKRNLGR